MILPFTQSTLQNVISTTTPFFVIRKFAVYRTNNWRALTSVECVIDLNRRPIHARRRVETLAAAAHQPTTQGQVNATNLRSVRWRWNAHVRVFVDRGERSVGGRAVVAAAIVICREGIRMSWVEKSGMDEGRTEAVVERKLGCGVGAESNDSEEEG
jgi:hypothetical protein